MGGHDNDGLTREIGYGGLRTLGSNVIEKIRQTVNEKSDDDYENQPQ